MSVHYKFKSNLDHDTVTFDGLNISVADLKKAIMHQKKIGKSSDFDLQITNAQTKEVYDNDEMLVPKNTSVIVARVPVQGGNKKNWDKPDLPLPIDEDDLGHIRYDRIAKNADLVNANTSEEDKVKAMITQSSQEYDPSKYVKSRSMTGPLPPSYTCFRCGKQGHWIKNCPTNNPDVKRSTGIPRSFMVPVDGPEHKGALLTSSGDYAVPLIDHQAYKEVKKEKPPFVPQEVPVAEPEADIPEELLCMVCKDLLQDAVLIPCCGNSFCDECVRQVLLESDIHECPVCHETDVSPNTLIPNRFLRTAVVNYKNETGYTRAMKAALIKSSPNHRADSPQPSPDSTVESQSHADSNPAPECSPTITEVKKEISDPIPSPAAVKIEEGGSLPQSVNTSGNVTPKGNAEDDSEDAQPGTPLADEPPMDGLGQNLPIQTIGQEPFQSDRYEYHSSHRYPPTHRDDFPPRHYADEQHLEPRPISTIETITNTRKKFMGRPAPVRQQFPNQRPHHDENRSEDYSRERDDYRGRYDRRHPIDRGTRRTAHQSHYDRPSRYPSNTSEYPVSGHDASDYDMHLRGDNSVRRQQERYRSPPHPVLVPPPAPAPIYSAPVPAILPPHPVLLPNPQGFPPQPPPPGASPVDTSHLASQPPPPGVGPLLPLTSDSTAVFGTLPYESEDPLKDAVKAKERSIDDRMEEFQRKLEKRDRGYSRDRNSRSRSRSSERHRSRSSSRSRSYSHSWSHSPSRSSSRTPRSRSRTPFSSRSRTRSYSHSRSRSWSKKRSYTRSRSRTRTESRSRSRSRAESRIRRRIHSRERQRPARPRTRSRSYSPKIYRIPSQRNLPYSGKHNYDPPQYGTGASYQSQYGPPPAIIPMPVMRPPAFPPHHLHSMHPPVQPVHSRPIDQYPMDRPPKYPPSYNEQYPPYDVYPPKYQRYEREQRTGEHRVVRYDKRQEYPRHQEEVPHRIPGWVGDRPRDYKPRYRPLRDLQRKEIRELPQITESTIMDPRSKEPSPIQPLVKKKEEKVSAKHKKHHHHHKSKESKKSENKIPVVVSTEKHSESSKNLKKLELIAEKLKEKSVSLESDSKSTKTSEKLKEKKHKHKKHKTGDQLLKKKRSIKKEKVEGAPSTDSDLPIKVKAKKKKTKPKDVEETEVKEFVVKQEKEPSPPPVMQSVSEECESSIPINLPLATVEVKTEVPAEEQDILDIFADDPDPEVADLSAETIPEINPADPEEAEAEIADNEAENAEETDNSEAEEEMEETVEDENVLHVDVPGISKWEREESEDEDAPVPQRRSSILISKDEKGSLSSDIISRAENVLLSKQFKPRIDKKEVSDSKDSSGTSSPEAKPVKHKETVELKSVVNTEPLKADSLQVTILNIKDKRSVYSRKGENRPSKIESVHLKQEKHSRTSHHHDESNLRRSIALHSTRSEERVRDHRDSFSDRRERKHSHPREMVAAARNSSSDRRDHSRKAERDNEGYDSGNVRKDERKHRFEDSHNGSSGNYSSSRERPERKKPIIGPVPQSHSRRPYEREVIRPLSKSIKVEKRSRSGSMDTEESYSSYKKKSDRKHVEVAEATTSQRNPKERKQVEQHEQPPRRKHSPIKPPGTTDYLKPLKRDYHDELKFEPDYDEFSDVEEKHHEVKERSKRKAVSPEVSRKSAKLEKPSKVESKPHKTDKSSIASSASSSAVSDSDSSDSDEHKGGKAKCSDSDHKQKHKKSKHKKHKKHKHKHKKKKSHKSKQKE